MNKRKGLNYLTPPLVVTEETPDRPAPAIPPGTQSAEERKASITRALAGNSAADSATNSVPTPAPDSDYTPKIGGHYASAAPPEPQGESYVALAINIELIDPSPYQPRLVFNESHLVELADSIAAKGQLYPIIVRPLENGRYELIGGERRLRAKRDILKHKSIDAIIRRLSDEDSAMLGLLDNEARDNLSDFESAQAYRWRLDNKLAKSNIDLARQIGKDRKLVDRRLSMLKLPARVQDLLRIDPTYISARMAADFVPFLDKDEDLVVEALESVFTNRTTDDDQSVTFALNWVKGKSRARHNPKTEITSFNLMVNGEPKAAVRFRGRDLVITPIDGWSSKDIWSILSAPAGADKPNDHKDKPN